MGIVQIETPDEEYGIEFHGKVFVIKPLAQEYAKAAKIFKNEEKISGEDWYTEILRAIKIMIPDFPIEEVSIMEIQPICAGITAALKQMGKKGSSPEE